MCGPRYDPAEAKKLLAEAGYPDGFKVGMDCPNDRYVMDEQICTAIVSMLARVGVKVDLNAQDEGEILPQDAGAEIRHGFLPARLDAGDL